MKNLIQKINQRKNQIEVLKKSQRAALAELSVKSKDVGLNLHCQIVQDIANVLQHKYQNFLSGVDVIAVCDNHHNFNKNIASAFYKSLDANVEFETGYNVARHENEFKNILWLTIDFNNYNKEAWGIDITLRTKSKFSNESFITNDCYETKKSNGFYTKGFNSSNIEQIVKDAYLLADFNNIQIILCNDIMALLNDLDSTQKDNDELVYNTRNTFEKAINNIDTEIKNLVDEYLSSMVGQSIDGGNISYDLDKNQEEKISNVWKLDIIKESPKSYRVNVHVCYKNGGYIDNAGNKVPNKRIDYIKYENILLPKRNVKWWFDNILYGVQNLDQIETYDKIRKFRDSKSIGKIYESGNVDKLYSSKQFKSMYNSLKNIYVSNDFTYMTDDRQLTLQRGCIWENLHSYSYYGGYDFQNAIKNYTPDNI